MKKHEIDFLFNQNQDAKIYARMTGEERNIVDSFNHVAFFSPNFLLARNHPMEKMREKYKETV